MKPFRSIVDQSGRQWTVVLPWAYTPAARGSSVVFESEAGEVRYGVLPPGPDVELTEAVLRECLEHAHRVD